MSFKKDFHEYRETKELEVQRLEETYGKAIKETVESVDSFEQQITINVGNMLKDLMDIKLQLTSGEKNAGDHNLMVQMEVTLQNLKQKVKQMEEDIGNMGDGSGGPGIGGKKKSALEDEIANIWSFLQRFADENAMDKIELIKTENQPVQAKIDVLGWLGRYNEFITLPMITQVVMNFKETLIPTSNAILRNNYITAKHSSHAVLNLVKTLQFLKYKFSEEDGKQKVSVILSILEPALVNDENATIATHIELVELLQTFLVYTIDELERRDPSKDLYQIPLYLKLVVRCLTSLLRLELAVGRYAKAPTNVTEMMKLII